MQQVHPKYWKNKTKTNCFTITHFSFLRLFALVYKDSFQEDEVEDVVYLFYKSCCKRWSLGWAALTGTQPCTVFRCKSLCGSAGLTMPESEGRNMQTDWQAQQTSHLVCSLAGQTCLEAWGTYWTSTGQITTALITWRKEKWRDKVAKTPCSEVDQNSTLRGPEWSLFSCTNIGTIWRATLGRLLRDGVERVWAFLITTMPSWAENWNRHWNFHFDYVLCCCHFLLLSFLFFFFFFGFSLQQFPQHSAIVKLFVISVRDRVWQDRVLHKTGQTGRGHLRHSVQGQESSDRQLGGPQRDTPGAWRGCSMHCHQRR